MVLTSVVKIHCSLIKLCITVCSDWFKEQAALSQLIRNKTNSLTHTFQDCVSVHVFFQVLICSLECQSPLWLARVLTLVFFDNAQSKITLRLKKMFILLLWYIGQFASFKCFFLAPDRIYRVVIHVWWACAHRYCDIEISNSKVN